MRLIVLLSVLLGLPAWAEEVRFPAAAVVAGSMKDTPPPLRAFLDRLTALKNDGAFWARGGADPVAALGGMSAKAWLLDHVAPDFECRRDFGGMCASDTAKIRFVMGFRGDETAWRDEADIDITGPGGLAALDFDFLWLPEAWDKASEHDRTGEFCYPAIPATTPDVDDLVAAYLGGGDAFSLTGLFHFMAVDGRYRVRRGPSLTAPVVNRVAHEVVFVPAPGRGLMAPDGRTWTFVVPPRGPSGFAAFEPGDLLPTSNVAARQICLEMRGDRPVFTARVGAGD